MARVIRHLGKAQTEFTKLYSSLCDRHQSWAVWSDFVCMAAVAISNAIDRGEKAEYREKQYLRIIGKYNKTEQAIFPQLLTIMVNELEVNPEQDFLGELFMALELGNHWKGQFFTPYRVCQMMAKMNLDGIEARIEKRGYVSINDPACGAGALLVAARNTMAEKKIDWSTKALFIAQDIDATAALMCYITLSLLGCAGYVVIGDSILHPLVGRDPLFPIEGDEQDYWYTPLWYHNIWQGRRLWRSVDLSLEKAVGDAERAVIAEDMVEHHEASKSPVIALNTDKTGQLTLF